MHVYEARMEFIRTHSREECGSEGGRPNGNGGNVDNDDYFKGFGSDFDYGGLAMALFTGKGEQDEQDETVIFNDFFKGRGNSNGGNGGNVEYDESFKGLAGSSVDS